MRFKIPTGMNFVKNTGGKSAESENGRDDSSRKIGRQG